MAVKVRSHKHFFQVIYYIPYRRSLSVKGHLQSKVVFRQRSSSVKGPLPSKVIFHQRLSSVKGQLPLTFVSRKRSLSVKGRLQSILFCEDSLGRSVKFGWNLFSSSKDIAAMDRCYQDNFWPDKCHHDRYLLLKITQETYIQAKSGQNWFSNS